MKLKADWKCRSVYFWETCCVTFVCGGMQSLRNRDSLLNLCGWDFELFYWLPFLAVGLLSPELSRSLYVLDLSDEVTRQHFLVFHLPIVWLIGPCNLVDASSSVELDDKPTPIVHSCINTHCLFFHEAAAWRGAGAKNQTGINWNIRNYPTWLYTEPGGATMWCASFSLCSN